MTSGTLDTAKKASITRGRWCEAPRGRAKNYDGAERKSHSGHLSPMDFSRSGGIIFEQRDPTRRDRPKARRRERQSKKYLRIFGSTTYLRATKIPWTFSPTGTSSLQPHNKLPARLVVMIITRVLIKKHSFHILVGKHRVRR